MSMELAHRTNHDAAFGDDDATACFDRLIVKFAALNARGYGCSEMVAATLGNTCKAAVHHIKTKHRVSKGAYYNTEKTPVYDQGEGVSFGPPCSGMGSSTMFKVLDKTERGKMVTNTQKEVVINQTVTAFVDDVKYSVNSPPNNTCNVRNTLQKTMRKWEKLLHGPGGKLEITKSYYSILMFKYNEKGMPVITRANEWGEYSR